MGQSQHLFGRNVGLEEVDDGVWNVYFGPLKLGRLLERHMRIEDALGRLKRHSRLRLAWSPTRPPAREPRGVYEGTARAPVDKSTCTLPMHRENRRLPVSPMSPDFSVTYLPDRSARPRWPYLSKLRTAMLPSSVRIIWPIFPS